MCAEVVEQFGIESILIFNALLLKKKVVVYAPSLETVLRVCRWVSVVSSQLPSLVQPSYLLWTIKNCLLLRLSTKSEQFELFRVGTKAWEVLSCGSRQCLVYLHVGKQQGKGPLMHYIEGIRILHTCSLSLTKYGEVLLHELLGLQCLDKHKKERLKIMQRFSLSTTMM